jgi:L-fucose isomerase-like protein
MRGDALDTPQRFNGTSVEVKLETDVSETLYKLMEEGFEPHYALVYEDVVEELVELGRQLGIKTTIFTN